MPPLCALPYPGILTRTAGGISFPRLAALSLSPSDLTSDEREEKITPAERNSRVHLNLRG